MTSPATAVAVKSVTVESRGTGERLSAHPPSGTWFWEVAGAERDDWVGEPVCRRLFFSLLILPAPPPAAALLERLITLV